MSKYEILYALAGGCGFVLGLIVYAFVASFKKSVPSAAAALEARAKALAQVEAAEEQIKDVREALEAELNLLNGVE